MVGAVAFAKRLALAHPLATLHERCQVEAGVLVGATELDEVVGNTLGIKTHHDVVVREVVLHHDFVGVHVINYAFTFRHNQRPRVAGNPRLQTRAHNRSLGAK